MPPAVSWPSLMQKELYMTAFAVIYSSFSYTVSSTRSPSGDTVRIIAVPRDLRLMLATA